MGRYTVVAIACFFLYVHTVFSQTFSITVNGGRPLVFQKKIGKRVPVDAWTPATMGDTLILAGGDQVTLWLEPNTRLVYRGAGTLSFSGDSGSAYVSFDNGTAFLDRSGPETFSVLTFWIKNYMFIPIGTAAAFKVMDGGRTPVVAVMDGTVLMQSPTGESVEVPAGRFGCIERPGRLASGTLGKNIVVALQSWSGCTSAMVLPSALSSSLEAIDVEFISAVEKGPPATVLPARPAKSAAQTSRQGTTAWTVPEQSVAPPAASGNVTPPEKKIPPPESPKPAEGQTAARTKDAASKETTAVPASPSPGTPAFELSAGAVTVGTQQWTRLALGIDVPVWKFGVFFDIEAFLDPRGEVSDKGWDFGDYPIEAATRKIRYLRFGREEDPVFVKIGGVSDVTLGYGFIVDRFTNMLHYPDQKQLGLQLSINDVTPLGLTLQIVGADGQELRSRDRGALGGVRVALKPLKTLHWPVVNKVTIGGTYGYDRNTYVPARYWKATREEELISVLRNHGLLSDTALRKALIEYGIDPDAALSQLSNEAIAKKKILPFGIYGADISLPLLASSFLSLDLYAQSGMRDDGMHGWGIGAPGAALKVWRLSAQLEYRRVEGAFMPGFFGPYYSDERLQRTPNIASKAESLRSETLNGAFGRLGFDIAGMVLAGGAYQYMRGHEGETRDQRVELTGAMGPAVLARIPKIKKIEAYFYKTRIGADPVKYDAAGQVLLINGKPKHDRFFEATPYRYYGLRAGFEIAPGAVLLWDCRYGCVRDSKGTLVPTNAINISTAFTF